MNPDRYTRAELLALLAEQLPDTPPSALDRVAGVLVLLLRPTAPVPTAPAQPPKRRNYKEKSAAERMRLKPS